MLARGKVKIGKVHWLVPNLTQNDAKEDRMDLGDHGLAV
jgi:hypothetical protein